MASPRRERQKGKNILHFDNFCHAQVPFVAWILSWRSCGDGAVRVSEVSPGRSLLQILFVSSPTPTFLLRSSLVGPFPNSRSGVAELPVGYGLRGIGHE